MPCAMQAGPEQALAGPGRIVYSPPDAIGAACAIADAELAFPVVTTMRNPGRNGFAKRGAGNREPVPA